MEVLSAGKAVRLSACMLERSWSWSMKISILWSMNTSFAVMLLAPNERDNRVWLSIFFYITDEQMEKPYPAEKQMQSLEK